MPDPMTDPVVILAASFLPLLIAVVKQSGLPPQYNALIALISYIVAGVASVALSGKPITSENLTVNIVTFTTIGTVIYQLVWKNLGDNGSGVSAEKRLTEATSIKKD